MPVQPDQSYSERQIYQAALDRLSRELAAVEDIDEEAATVRLEEMLKAGPNKWTLVSKQNVCEEGSDRVRTKRDDYPPNANCEMRGAADALFLTLASLSSGGQNEGFAGDLDVGLRI